MTITSVSSVVQPNRGKLYTLVQVEHDAGIQLSGDQDKREMQFTRTILPEYVSPDCTHGGSRSSGNVHFIVSHLIPSSNVYSGMGILFFKKPVDDAFFETTEMKSTHGLTLGRHEITGKEVPADTIKSVLLEHLMVGYNEDVKSVQDLRERHYRGRVIDLKVSGPSQDTPIDAAISYDAVLTSILTGKRVSDLIEGKYHPIECFTSDFPACIKATVSNPTLARTNEAAAEFVKFLDYVEKNKAKLFTMAAALWATLDGDSVFDRLQKGFGEIGEIEAGEDLADDRDKMLMERIGALEKEIAALPKCESRLAEYF